MVEFDTLHHFVEMPLWRGSQVLQGVAVLSNQRLYDKSVPYASARVPELFPFLLVDGHIRLEICLSDVLEGTKLSFETSFHTGLF
jgi:hypothetical protein